MKNFMIFGFVLFVLSPAGAQNFDFSELAQVEGIGASAEEYDSAFIELDVDKNGSLSERELLKFQQNGLATEKDETYKVFDTNDDGKVDETEYKAFFQKQAPQSVAKENLTQIFKDMDANNDGNLSPEELKNYRQNNLEAQNREIFKLMDFNQDGKVSKEEFAGFMHLTKSILGNLPDF